MASIVFTIEPAKQILKPRDDVYGPYDSSYLQQSLPKTHTQSPAVTGTSVLGVKFKDGVVIAADNLGMFRLSLSLPASVPGRFSHADS